MTIILFGFVGYTDLHHVIIELDLSRLKMMPSKIVIEQTGLGGYDNKEIIIQSFQSAQTVYKDQILEPQLLRLTAYWKDEEPSSIDAWILPGTYRIKFGSDLRPVFITGEPNYFTSKVDSIEHAILKRKTDLNRVLKNVSYTGKKISQVEQRIAYIRDSVDKDIDEEVYLKIFNQHLNSPIGLYALCKYADRPYANQRFKAQPDKIEELLNKLDTSISKLPSGNVLMKKIKLGKEMQNGNSFDDISLSDTLGKVKKISQFRGKYLLVDFWASWCTPCRAENPTLIKAYKKYKDKGFEIVSITIDDISAKQNWLSAIRNDHTGLWLQLSDFDYAARKLYGIRFIPANYLLDPKGLIVARDLKGEDLVKKLGKIFLEQSN